jgi:arylsulfatase A-like enzyme
VGRIVAALEEHGKRENTLVVFTSDNGGSTAENNDLKYPDDHCPNGKLPGNNAPFRGGKGTLYEGGTRVPTIVQWPRRVKPGRIECPVQITDWMPTFCALAGYQGEQDLKWDGIDLSGLLVDRSEPAQRPLYAVAPGWRARSLRLGPWKLIVQGEGEARKVELFHVTEDPAETTNRAEQQADRVEQWLQVLDKAAAGDRDAVANDSR